ncbi:hypothetical protein LCGC14_2740630, partial [marine sediment metagenome]
MELKHAQAALKANKSRLDKKWSVFTAVLTPEMSDAPFIGYERKHSDLMEMP